MQTFKVNWHFSYYNKVLLVQDSIAFLYMQI